MKRFKQRSQWFEGLLHAERMGVVETTELMARNEYKDSDLEFQLGVMDYLIYNKKVLQNVRENN